MADSAAFPSHAGVRAVERTASIAIPWYIWAVVVAATSAIIGVLWDISWHRSIGRDTFLTAPHQLIYLCGIIAGVVSGYLILFTTFAKDSALKASSVTIWGLTGPLGAFISAWGGFAMLTSAPFDDWWHSAYGLDVKILSPPHMILAAGIIAIILGAMILIAGFMNRAEGREREQMKLLFVYVGTMIMMVLMIVITEFTQRVFQHVALMYRVVACVVPIVMVAVARGSRFRWAATMMAAVYTLIVCSMIWILPLFPATPKLGPVLHQVTQFIPPDFPLLLIAPALLLDWIWSKTAGMKGWTQAAISGVVFVVALIAVQWPFAEFLMTPWAANGLFGSMYRDYATGPNSAQARNVFVHMETMQQFWTNLGLAVLIAIVTSRIGLAWGEWMRGIKR